MANFNIAKIKLSATEGGLARLKGDTGGLTYKGIAQNYHPYWPGWPAVESIVAIYGNESDKQLSRRLERNLQLQAHVNDFYRDWWERIGAGALSQDLANLYFDFYIHKPVAAVKTMQEVLNRHFGYKLAEDGTPGPNTNRSAAMAPQGNLYRKYREARLNYYESIAERNPRYGQSFINRVLWNFPEKKKPLA